MHWRMGVLHNPPTKNRDVRLMDTILPHFSPLDNEPITYEGFCELARMVYTPTHLYDNIQVYWSRSIGPLVQDFSDHASIPAQPISWETMGRLIDDGILILNVKHSWEGVKRWSVNNGWV